MNDSIRHRGPDDHGALVEGGVGIGMRRLSIVDLSACGHQPLFNEDQSVAVVFNGEIYNHRDLRSPPGGRAATPFAATATPRCWSTATSSSARAS